VITWHGIWGDWAGSPDLCPFGSFVYGFVQKSEPGQGGGDDTALNAILLHCRNPNRKETIKSITSSQGPWGDWGTHAWCSSSTPVIGFAVKEEPSQGGGDDTSLNEIALYCMGKTVALHSSVKTGWGSWKPWQRCPSGFAVAGLRTRVERPQGGGDDTALNGIQLYCRKYP